jgi:NADH-quinone oxidoreductase subunit N
MFFREPAEGVTVVRSAGLAEVAIGVTAVLTVLLGIFPAPVLDLLNQITILIP